MQIRGRTYHMMENPTDVQMGIFPFLAGRVTYMSSPQPYVLLLLQLINCASCEKYAIPPSLLQGSFDKKDPEAEKWRRTHSK